MGFDGFALISLFYLAIGVQAVYRLIRNWNSVWDQRFTGEDRHIVDQAAFFVLVPVSVLLHEGGHAVMVRFFGADIVDFGFYGFAGYVTYDGWRLSDLEVMIIAAAGSFVNLVLCLAAIGVALWGPFRAPINELLIQFAFISGVNTFVVYPLLDLASGLNGDWRQMYDGGVPWFTGLVVVVQLAVLGAGYLLATDSAWQQRIGRVVAVPPGFVRGAFGGLKPTAIASIDLSPNEREIQEAIERVKSGWPHSVQTTVERHPQVTVFRFGWQRDSRPRVGAVRMWSNGMVDIVGLLAQPGQSQPQIRPLQTWHQFPAGDELTMALRVQMERIDSL